MAGAAVLFRQRFGVEPEIVVRAPGRVNLIGEHTDYNDGFVLPAAIDVELELACRRAGTSAVALESREAPNDTGWRPYVEGVRELLAFPLGIEGVIASAIPLGGGLSSSAALELAVARALVALNEAQWEPLAIAKLAQRAEIEYTGNRCGIMDQLAVACGQAGHALLIDCRSLAIQAVRMPNSLGIVVCDSAKPRQLVESAYNERRAACEEAAQLLDVPALRDASPAAVEALPEPLRKRALHVTTENQRALEFARALEAGRTDELGRLMLDSHASLRDLYEVSCHELDLLVELATELEGCIGSRLTGAGFGGCTVSLVQGEHADAFGNDLVEAYRQRTGLPGRGWVTRAVDGVSLVG